MKQKKIAEKKILLVDDEEALLESISLLLEHEGADVSTATGGDEAFDYLKQENFDFDIVITDVRMPKGTGKELVEKIRKTKSEIPVICVSGYSDFSNDEILSWGTTEFLYKPVKIDSIINSIINLT